MKILLVEDDAEDAEFLRLSLAQQNRSVALTCAGSVGEAVTALENGQFDVVLLDLNLPDARGAECVERIRETDELMPVVVLSGQGDEDFAVEILNRGVQDYLVKWEGDGRIILRAIRYAIERKRAEIKVSYCARRDWLTNLPNRHYLSDELVHVMKRALRGERTMALLLLDLDGFKAVNETHGRTAGDALLRAVAARLEAAVREGDRLARIGADEFAVLVEDAEGPREVEALARKVTAAFVEPFQAGGRQIAITASVGVTVCPADGSDAAAVLDNAGIALAKARQQGRNQFKFYDDGMHERVVVYERLAAELRRAAEQNLFELRYQPQVRLADHRIESVEAQLRWPHPEHGALGPAEFMPVAEQSGSSIRIGLWVLDEACRQLKRWEEAGVPVPRVAIDVSAAQLREPNFPEAVRRVVEAHAVDPELVELELPGRALADGKEALHRLHALKDVGVRLAVDDFGAGPLRLADLQRFPLDVLKIADSLIADVETSKDDQIVCSVLLSVIHGFALHAVANGVKSAQQEAFLMRHDCLYGQGELYGAPIDAEQVAALMAKSGGQATRRRRVVRRRIGAKAG